MGDAKKFAVGRARRAGLRQSHMAAPLRRGPGADAGELWGSGRRTDTPRTARMALGRVSRPGRLADQVARAGNDVECGVPANVAIRETTALEQWLCGRRSGGG